MSKIRKKKSPDGLPESHPAFAPVEPEHLAFAFHCGWGVQTARMRAENPADHVFDLEMENGEVQTIALADTPFSRINSAVMKELRSFLPGDDPGSLQKRAAVMMRLSAMAKILQMPEIARLIREDSEGKFSLPGFVTTTCATAPITGEYADFAHSSFLKILEEAQKKNSGVGLELRLPDEIIVRTDGHKAMR